MSAYVPATPDEAFDRARGQFEVMVSWLSGVETGELDHARLEQELDVRGREVLRLLFQDHLDLRAARETRREDVVGADGVARVRVEKGHQRDLATVFGQVRVTRMAYRAVAAPNLYPADGVLNLPLEKHSHGLRRLAAVESVRGSFEQAGQAIERATGVRVGKRQVQQLARAAAVDVDGFYAARRPGSSPEGDVLVLSFDGKGIVMRPGALRKATARAAASASHKLTTRLSRGEKRNRKRMAEVGSVYDATPVSRTAADIIRTPGDQPQSGNHRPRARGKWLTASVVEDIPTVICTTFQEADRRDPDHTRTWIALVDGNTTQIDHIHTEAKRRSVQVSIVCDFIHVLEYLWKAAWSFFYEADPDAEQWVADQARKILDGRSHTVAAAIRRQATRGGFSPDERKGADTAANYLTAKRPYLNYAHALEQGWPIATGIIEGACRHLVKDRMDITGARWALPSAEAILTLRALTNNGDFDTYWNHHLAQEQQRIHHTRHRKDHELAA